jgi:hypothetical protein
LLSKLIFSYTSSYFSTSNEEILSLLIESGAKASDAGWMQIMDDQIFGTPLVLAHWIKNKYNGHPMAENILNLISKENQRHCNNVHPKRELKQLVNTVNK